MDASPTRAPGDEKTDSEVRETSELLPTPGGEVAPLPEVSERRSLGERFRREPFVRLFAYYVLLVVVGAVLVTQVPIVDRAFIEPVNLPAVQQGVEILQGTPGVETPSTVNATTTSEVINRALTTLVVIIGALALVVPVAGVYMQTKRLRYDPSLVRSVIILPIVVAGIALVVKNSVALAFSLAGIVAAVRFRNTLKDPRDAVYIFLVIGIGLSAGVQALDVALVMSMVFNVVVLALWRFNIGTIYGGRYGRTGVLSTGASALLVAQAPEHRREIRKSLLGEAEDMKTDGILLVHAQNIEQARHTVAEAVSEMAKDWRLARIVPRGEENFTLEYLVRLKKKTTPAELIGALGERWSSQVSAAEYIPFRTRSVERSPEDEAEKEKK